VAATLPGLTQVLGLQKVDRMKREQANLIADQLLQEAQAERKPALAATASRRATTTRVVAGMIGIIGYHFGMRLASDLTANVLAQNGIAVAIGLLAAAVWPPRRQT